MWVFSWVKFTKWIQRNFDNVELSFCLSTKYFSLSYFWLMSLLLNYIVHQNFCMHNRGERIVCRGLCVYIHHIYEFSFQRYLFFFRSFSFTFFSALSIYRVYVLWETLNSFCVCVPKWIEPNSSSANTHIKTSMRTVYALIPNKLVR